MTARSVPAGRFQFTCPSRSTTECEQKLLTMLRVSIHVPLAEHDRNLDRKTGLLDVSIHVPLAEHDLSDNML